MTRVPRGVCSLANGRDEDTLPTLQIAKRSVPPTIEGSQGIVECRYGMDRVTNSTYS